MHIITKINGTQEIKTNKNFHVVIVSLNKRKNVNEKNNWLLFCHFGILPHVVFVIMVNIKTRL